MKVPLQLKRKSSLEPAVAALLLGTEPIDAFRVCARIGLDPTGRLFAVEGGFVIKLEAPTSQPLAGLVRLRRSSTDLYVPVDAELVPALLDDEAEGLVQGRALVFPPWGGVLSFDPRHPLDLRQWLKVEASPRLSWQPFPERMVLAERIETILLELPHESSEQWLEPGAEGIGSEEPRPEEAGPLSTMAGKASFSLGRGLVWLGRVLGLKGLARLGAEWVGEALKLAPQLNEAVLGRQAAALKALLREFREGDLEQALRRALPLGDTDPLEHGSQIATSDNLPQNSLAYSLGELLSTSTRRPARVWLSAGEVLNELKREYRKAAEEAQRRGDPRRAALIYGKLLKDFRMAAHALSRAGLHHDAAVLLLTKLEDWRAAAVEFEAAGEIDRALRFYQQAADHEAAGDLLVRVGDIEEALIEYQCAAERLLTSEGGHLAAGRLLALKAKRPDLALAHFLAGWSQRPLGNAIACLIEATDHYAQTGSAKSIVGLIDEVDAHLANEPSIGAEWDRYYHDLGRLAGRPLLASIRDELQDRARLGLAARLRGLAHTGSPPGRLVSEVFGRSGVWPSTLVRDAEFAVRSRAKTVRPPSERIPQPGESRRMKLGMSPVTAACAAFESDDLFLGFEAGEVYRFRPERNEVVLVATQPHPVTALAASGDGQSLVVLRATGLDSGVLSSYAASPDGTYRLVLAMTFEDLCDPWLTPVLTVDGVELVGVWDGQALYYLTVRTLTYWGNTTLTRPDADPPAGLLLAHPGKTGLPFSVLIHDGREWCLVEPSGTSRHATGLVWKPSHSQTQSNSLGSVILSWYRSDVEHLELVGLDREGALFWALLRFEEGLLDLVASHRILRGTPYLTATLIRSRLVAAVSGTQIEWLRCGADRFTVTHATRIELPTALACFPSRRTGELLVVSRDGVLDRISFPF